MASPPPETFGKYVVSSLLHRQGGVAVYCAYDPLLERQVVVRVLQAAQDPDDVARFTRRARQVAALRHPYVVQVYDFGMAHDQPFVATEYLEGGSLRRRLARYAAAGSRMPPAEVAVTLERLADGLDYAHALPVVHGPLDPAHIYFTSRSEPVLTAFGLAEASDAAYRAPGAGEVPSAWDDLYSLGVLLYEMLTGRHPAAPVDPATLEAMAPALSKAAAAVVQKALDPDPAKRFVTAGDLARAFHTALRTEAGVQEMPVGRTPAFYPRERAGLPGAPTEPTPPSQNLPPLSTRLVGRQSLLAAVSQRLDDAACRLLTLVGPGGAGKTVLALQAATARVNQYDDGCYWVALAGTHTAEHLVAAVADAVGFAFYGDSDHRQQLLQYLREKHLLLVLDSFEQVPDGADLLTDVLQAAPRVTLCVTSLLATGLPEEHLLEVRGLDCPDDAHPDNAAVQLFTQAARRANPDFALRDADRPHLARLCRLVGGTPLGLELAATWAATLSPEAIADQIAESADFLAEADHALPEDLAQRHRSLRSVFDYTWRLLDADQQVLFRRLAVFRGGFTREAAQAVAGAQPDDLAGLVEKSLLRRTSAGRYDMLETVRHYAAEHLRADPDAPAVRARYVAHYAGLLADQWPALTDGRQREATARIREEIENVRHAWDAALTGGHQADLRRMFDALYRFYEVQGWLHEGLDAFGRALAAFDADAEPLLAACLRARVGSLHYRQGHREQARAYLAESLEALQRHPDDTREEMAFAYNYLGATYYLDGAYEDARRYFYDALHLNRELDNRLGIAINVHHLALLEQALGHPREARHLHQESLKVSQRLGDPFGIAVSLDNLGTVACRLGDHDEAQRLHEESLALRREIGDRWGVAASISGLGWVAFATGALDDARQYFRDSIARYRAVGDQRRRVEGLLLEGRVALRQEHLDEAETAFAESLALAQEIGYGPGVVRAHHHLGVTAAARGDESAAAAAFYHALAAGRHVEDAPLLLRVLERLARLDALDASLALALTAFVRRHPASGEAVRASARTRYETLMAAHGEEAAREAAARTAGRSLHEVVDLMLAERG